MFLIRLSPKNSTKLLLWMKESDEDYTRHKTHTHTLKKLKLCFCSSAFFSDCLQFLFFSPCIIFKWAPISLVGGVWWSFEVITVQKHSINNGRWLSDVLQAAKPFIYTYIRKRSLVLATSGLKVTVFIYIYIYIYIIIYNYIYIYIH